jgi:hypothetical protein
MFLHGQHPAFLAALAEVPGNRALKGWPGRVRGQGAPCQPDALESTHRRFVFVDGLDAFPRHLAAGLDLRPGTTVTAIRPLEGGFEVLAEDGASFQGRHLVLALALEETLALLGTLPAQPEILGIQALLGMFRSLPALTLVTGYLVDGPAPPWDLLLPDSPILQLVAQDSSKRTDPRFLALVCQGRPGWSRTRLDQPAAAWSAELLAAASAALGPWAGAPLWTHPQRWRHARVDRSSELAQPVRIRYPRAATLGLAGDLFAPGGGVQAAWLSGFRLAEALLQEKPA